MNDVTTMDPRDAAEQRSTGVAVQDLTGRAPAHYSLNHGAVAIEQERAIAEVQGQIIIAQRCPRDVVAATAEFLEACKMPEFAAKAFYTVPNRGSGPSIRFAEEAARCYGNFEFGHLELSRGDGKSEVEVYAWDKQKNNRSKRQITVMHYRDKKGGPPVLLTDQTDIDNRVANVASKQMRGRILALLPKAMVAAGEAMAKKTLAGDTSKPLSARIMDMTQAFADQHGVNVTMLETYIGHSLQTLTIDELADMQGVFTALREGAKVSEYFNADGEVAGGGERNDKLDAAAAKGRQTRVTKKPDTATEDKKTPTEDDKRSDQKTEQQADQKSEQKPDEKTKETPAEDRKRNEAEDRKPDEKKDQQEERQQDRRQQSDQREQQRDDRDDRQQEERRDPPREERQQESREQRDPREASPDPREQRDDRRDQREERGDPRDQDDRDEAPPPRDDEKPTQRRESVF